MKIARITVSATIAALGAATAVALCGTASAAPTGVTSATETISQLQAEGKTVVIDKVGAGSMEQCSVTSVRSVERQALAIGSPLTGVPIPQRETTVHVGLAC